MDVWEPIYTDSSQLPLGLEGGWRGSREAPKKRQVRLLVESDGSLDAE